MSASFGDQSEKETHHSDRSFSRTQANSLVGHRLSQHISVTAQSEEGDQVSEGQRALHADRNVKHSSSKSPSRSREDDVGKHGVAAAKSDHAIALKVKTCIFNSRGGGTLTMVGTFARKGVIGVRSNVGYFCLHPEGR